MVNSWNAGKQNYFQAFQPYSLQASQPASHALFACLPAAALKAKGGHLNLEPLNL
jgi:hypothetical protein